MFLIIKRNGMAGLFNRKPKISPRTDIVLGLIFIAQGALGLNNYYNHYEVDSGAMLVAAWCFCGICGGCFFVRGLLRI
jgi:hypothetical protein